MNEVKFSVGAKAARLIGRENIADVDGALVELIKNAYDADASCVLVKMHIPFPEVPSKIKIGEFTDILLEKDLEIVLDFYDYKDGEYKKKDKLTNYQQDQLEDILFSYNQIIIADNGCGMTWDIVSSTWMYIGTSDKESNFISDKGRIKTGAKGIGRFSLDKLSKKSLMYTKSKGSDNVIKWNMDWEQFVAAKLIDEVKAELDKEEVLYETLVSEIFTDSKEIIKEHNWETGTLLVLSPTREPWSKRLFQKVNTNLKSINPIGSADLFDVVIKNIFFPEYHYRTEKVAIDSDDYDYRILADYDGQELMNIRLLRNELDLSMKKITVEKFNQSATKTMDEFWSREKLQVVGYRREDFGKEIAYKIKVQDILLNDEIEKIQSVGPFQAEMYFLRNANSSGYDIMKKVTMKKRRTLLSHFSGIKIYRDEFKVRPYGDEGSLYDWLGLGSRAQKSPAAPSHPTGRWRVEPYQMIGLVKIGREKNPGLADMANREGIALNDTYYIFVSMIQEAIDKFEFDRQYIYREYARWIESIENELSDFSERVKEEALRRAQEQKRNTRENHNNENKDKNEDQKDRKNDENSQQFTEDEMFGTVQRLIEDSEKELNSKQIMQILSSSGVILNTFFHEFNAINTQFHIQASQIRSRINYILQGKEYTGLPAYNPYTRIDVLEKNDLITAAFLDVVMDGLKKNNLIKQEISIQEIVSSILEKWKLILEGKHITIRSDIFETKKIDDKIKIAVVDMYIILNNFLLNSAWFLEQEHNPNREVAFTINEEESNLCILMENNGPPLPERFRNNPDKIFELGETSKGNEGTGLGLWVVKETVERYSGSIAVIEKTSGFGLKIVFKR